jgi:APA family basic amino acid/polyamine antiporter
LAGSHAGVVTEPTRERPLVRGLGPWSSASIVVGTVIGTGVFLKAAVMAQSSASPAWVLAAWATAALLSFTGAMTYAELGGMFPASGGEYVYLRRGYGPFMAFLYAWIRFWIGAPGSIAAYAVGSATFLSVALPLDKVGGIKPLAIALIAVFTALNCMNVRSGGRLQTVLTGMKLAMILGLAAGALLTPHGSWGHLVAGSRGFPGWSAFGAMVLAALWAYDGWNNLPMAAGEIRDPARNLPRAVVGGMLAVLAIYALVNLGYFHALPIEDIAAGSSKLHPEAPAVAAKVAMQFLGGTAQVLLAIAMTLSALSAMNGSILTGARVPYAVARDGLAPRGFARVSAGARVPATALLVQGGVAAARAASGSFAQKTDAVVFVSWLFYGLNAGSVLMLRRREPARHRPFRVPGFPVVPIVFIGLAILLIGNTVSTTPGPSALGLGMVALGAVVYAVFLRGKARPLPTGDGDV